MFWFSAVYCVIIPLCDGSRTEMGGARGDSFHLLFIQKKKKKVSGDLPAVVSFSGLMRMWNYGENCCSSIAVWFIWVCSEHKRNLTQSPST